MKRILCLCVLACVLLCGCAGKADSAQKTVFCMDTVMDLQIWGRDAETGIQQITALLDELDNTWSAVSEGSLLSRLNRGESVSLSDTESALLERVEALSERTGGAFNPKLRALSECWGFYNENYRIPSPEEIAAALQESQLDLGAAIKGYAGYSCVELLSQLNIDRAMLVLGGNVQTYGEKPDGTPWQIGIQDPNGGDSLGVLSVTGTISVVTSGDYQRYFEIDGVKYHHILDPETGYPADSGLCSVTILCRDGLTADCLSTALFVMGLEKASEFWRESSDFEAVLITTEGKIYATEGVILSGCQYEEITR